MDIFEKKVKFSPQRIYRLIARQVGQDINGLSEPCYTVHTQKFEATLYREMGITTKDIKDFMKRTYNGTKWARFQTVNVPFTFLLAYIYHRFARTRKKNMAETILMYSIIKHYGSVANKQFPKVCLDDVFRYTLANITKVHLFYKHKTVANAIIHISRRLHQMKYSIMDMWEPDKIAVFITDGRTRISQSTKSFAEHYYRNHESGKGIATERTPESEDEMNMLQTSTGAAGRQAAVDKFIKSMFVYKNYDKKAVMEAKRVSRVKPNLAESIIPAIHDKSSEENIKIILTSFLKEMLDVRSLCSPKFFTIVRKLLMVRNYKDTFLFRNLVIKFTNEVYESTSPPTRQIRTRDERDLVAFVAFYITISFRNLFCSVKN